MGGQETAVLGWKEASTPGKLDLVAVTQDAEAEVNHSLETAGPVFKAQPLRPLLGNSGGGCLRAGPGPPLPLILLAARCLPALLASIAPEPGQGPNS